MNFKLAALWAAVILSAAAAGAETRCTLTVIDRAGRPVPLAVEIARTDAERGRGLMFRKTLAADSGMLFVFEREQPLSFWMKSTYIPLSIAFIDKYGIIREMYDMKPLDETLSYPSRYMSMYALEVNRGWFARRNIAVGSRIVLDGCVGQ
jgi:uncharacterized membrane protein (UPF0127 family)